MNQKLRMPKDWAVLFNQILLCSSWNVPVTLRFSPPISCTKFCHPILTTNLHTELSQEHITKDNLELKNALGAVKLYQSLVAVYLLTFVLNLNEQTKRVNF